MFLSAQLAFAVQQQQNDAPNPFMSAYANLLTNPSLIPSLMSESLKAARFSPYSKPHFNTTITTTKKSKTSLKAIKKNISITSQQSLSSQRDEELYLDNRMSLSDERLSSSNDTYDDEKSGAKEESWSFSQCFHLPFIMCKCTCDLCLLWSLFHNPGGWKSLYWCT